MTKQLKLPFSQQIAYAIGQLGWSTLINIINLQLVYFYIPPTDANIQNFIPQTVFLVVLNTLTLIAAGGRLFDAITDPLIANMSDNWKGKKGRRIPFLGGGAFPAALFCVLMFLPIFEGISGWNVVWLVFTQIGFYLFLTAYVTPYFALLPELGHTSNERLNLSTYISVTYALGIVLASQVPVFASVIDTQFQLNNAVSSLQMAIAFAAFIAMIFMFVPYFFVDENKYSQGQRSNIPLKSALQNTFKNPNFVYYVVADLAYFTGLTIVMTGLLYYITVLLSLGEGMMGLLLPLLVVVSFVFYPIVNFLAKKVGKKYLVVISFLLMSIIFFVIFYLGNLPFSATAQAYGLILGLAIPISFLSILPNAILADIAEHDAQKSGIHQQGMFFAARTLMQKFGQTFGVLIFAALTTLGKDPGNDLGIRISGIVGFLLCIFAGIYFTKYDEKNVLDELEKFQNKK